MKSDASSMGGESAELTRVPAARVLPEVCLGVVVPAYNEVKTMGEMLRRVAAQGCVQEVVVVDDGSVDASFAVAQDFASGDCRVQVLKHTVNRGKGAAVRAGLKRLSAPLVIVQDADLEYDPSDYARLLEPIRQGVADVVYGSRFIAPRRHSGPWWHLWGNAALTWAANWLTGLRLTDEATGYKVLRREVLVRMGLREDRFGFCPEVTAKVARQGLRLVEVPIAYAPRTIADGKKVRLRDGFAALWCLVKYSKGHCSGHP